MFAVNGSTNSIEIVSKMINFSLLLVGNRLTKTEIIFKINN